ncbi:MAG: class I SAM-dependent methyltransferase [Oscillatoriaceae bacterium SKYG93]|nr:class I SAM-dependent methyltransferase [Oscillatoriaceae bacterium SKYG93]MDW8451991.1 class I SAM-dependent methyltransferase [Oscillatoriaceae cyanobacterium SKYGB_i_bin93]
MDGTYIEVEKRVYSGFTLMSSSYKGFQDYWEIIRKQGKQIARYPYDRVISFVFKYLPSKKARDQIKILEIGCGAGNNLWPLAKEGFKVYGVDASETVISIAKEQFKSYNVDGEFFIQSFVEELPFESNYFDLVIDRGALTLVSFNDAITSVQNIHRVMKSGAFLYFNPYSSKHSSYVYSEKTSDDAKYVEPSSGTVANVGKVCFYNSEDIQGLFPSVYWKIEQLREIIWFDYLDTQNNHAEWEVVLKKL